MLLLARRRAHDERTSAVPAAHMLSCPSHSSTSNNPQRVINTKTPKEPRYHVLNTTINTRRTKISTPMVTVDAARTLIQNMPR